MPLGMAAPRAWQPLMLRDAGDLVTGISTVLATSSPGVLLCPGPLQAQTSCLCSSCPPWTKAALRMWTWRLSNTSLPAYFPWVGVRCQFHQERSHICQPPRSRQGPLGQTGFVTPGTGAGSFHKCPRHVFLHLSTDPALTAPFFLFAFVGDALSLPLTFH